jgi:hypothetical protein
MNSVVFIAGLHHSVGGSNNLSLIPGSSFTSFCVCFCCRRIALPCRYTASFFFAVVGMSIKKFNYPVKPPLCLVDQRPKR